MNHKVGSLNVRVYPDRTLMGAAAAADCAQAFRKIIAASRTCRAVFAAAPSQSELLSGLVAASEIDWKAVEAFHMDEYLGLGPSAPQAFGTFLRERLFAKLPFRTVNYIFPDTAAPAYPIPPVANEFAAEAKPAATRYSALLATAPLDIVCLGVGENGHIAFNDPPVADFDDPLLIKKVELDEICRRQQVNDGCFPSMSAVPRFALTLTIPALCGGRHLFCVVPGAQKANAIRRMLTGPISEDCPASILRRHPDCILYLDADSAREWLETSS